MNLHHKKVLAVIIALIILCTISIACVVFTLKAGGINKEGNPKNETSIVETELEITETIEEIKNTEISEEEICIDDSIVVSDTESDKTENPSKVNKTEIKDVTTESVATETMESSKLSYTDDDLFYLAAAVCREAGGCSEEIQLLVANVIINRVNSPLYPNTIYGVLTQRMQYGMMWKYGVSFPSWADESVKNQCYSVAQRVLDGERFCPDNVIFQAEFKQGSGVYKEFDGFYFCYR